jgi:SAM-dependent methyltransferase
MTDGATFVRRDTCPACGGARTEEMRRIPYDRGPLLAHMQGYYWKARDVRAALSGGTYEVVRCTDCGLVFQRYVAGDALLSTLYDDWLNSEYHPDHDPFYVKSVARPASTRDGHEVLAVARALGRPTSSLRVLDYGMGWGLWARIAHGLGAYTFGYDLSATRRTYASANGIHVVDVDELSDLGLDFVNVDQVLEHLSSPFEVTELLARALRPGGILKIAVPHAKDIARRLRLLDFGAKKYSRNALTAIQPLEHVNCFSKASLSRMLGRVRLTPRRVPPTAYAAFLLTPGGLPRQPVAIAKAFARPLYNEFSRTNLYAWFQKPETA